MSFIKALSLAYRLHCPQVPKGSLVPYVSRPLALAIILENGDEEETPIAALLHDAGEDQGDLNTLNEVRSRFAAWPDIFFHRAVNGR